MLAISTIIVSVLSLVPLLSMGSLGSLVSPSCQAGLSQPSSRLPPPKSLDMPLGEALAKRRSVRSFDPGRRPSAENVSALLWAASGITRPEPEHPQGGKRTAPSAFGAGSVEVFVASADGWFLYDPKAHALERRGSEDLRATLAGADWARGAPVIFVFVADLERYPERVPAEERRIYAYADGAAAGENLYLAATALGLGTVLTMAPAREVSAALGLRESELPTYVFPVGCPSEESGATSPPR